jgi:predicted metalloprotease
MRVLTRIGSCLAALLTAVAMTVGGAAPAAASESGSAALPYPGDPDPGAAPATMYDFQAYWFTDVADWWNSIGVTSGAYYVFPAPGEPFSTACGNGPDDLAAFYCAGDDTVVFSQVMAALIWEGTVDLTGQFGGEAAGDMGVVYALAHEYAHNIQFEQGLLDAGYSLTTIELHADCWAGVYSRAKEDAGQLDATDVDEAITTAARVGNYDYENPDFHGTPEQRVEAFQVGFTGGEPLDCDAVLDRDPNL